MSSLDDVWGDVTEKKEKGEEETPPVEEQPTEEKPTEEPATEEKAETKEVAKPESGETQESSEPDTEEEEASAEEGGLWGDSAPTVEEEAPPAEVVKAPEVPSAPTPPKPSKTPVIDHKTEIVEVEGEKYDTSPDHGSIKRVFTIYGLKGEGKTGLSLSFPGKVVALSFDRKTVQVWKELFKGAERITVYDAIRYLNKSSGEMWLSTADVTLKYVTHLLNTEIKKLDPDWILIDGAQIFTQLCEMVMRYRNGLQPFQGIANRNLWKERRMHIDNIHNACIAIAKEGLIYTTYTTKDTIHKDGQIIDSKDVPAWIDAIMVYTDVVIRVKSKPGETGREFTADIESSKTSKIKTGARVDITGTEGYKKLTGD